MRRNDEGKCMVEHHICYEETEGWDETILMPFGEHQTLHRRMRKEGRCNIPAERLRKISTAASNRTEKMRATKAIWHEENPNYFKEWEKKNPDYQKEYYRKNKEKIKERNRECSRERYARKKERDIYIYILEMEKKNNVIY